VSAAGPAAADRPRARRPAALQTTTDDDDRRQRAKQYWPIRRASKNIPSLTPYVWWCYTTSLINFIHLLRSKASLLFSYWVWQSLSQRFSRLTILAQLLLLILVYQNFVWYTNIISNNSLMASIHVNSMYN